MNLNAQSVVNKSHALESILLTHDPHVCVITETWLTDYISDGEVFPDQYNVFRRDRDGRGGGLAVLLKPGIEAVLETQIENHESLFLRINCC